MKKISELSCADLRGVGPQLMLRLAKLGIHTVQDLLFYLPFRYEDRTHITPITHARPKDHVLIEGAIIQTQIRFGRRRSLLCTLRDQTGYITLRFFYFTQSQQKQLQQPGIHMRCFGEIRLGINGFEMVHPEYSIITDKTTVKSVSETLTPIYPTTEGLQQRTFRQLTEQALTFLAHTYALEEFLPPELLQQFSLPDLKTAIHDVHRPPPDSLRDALATGMHPAQQRLAFEELLAHQLSLQKRRLALQRYHAPAFKAENASTAFFLKHLSFSLTAAQQRVIGEIKQDLMRNFPMLRLVQGDVGSGKTVVAAIAALQVIHQGYQVALMAPTELLAEQHAHNFQHWFSPLDIHTVNLTGSLKTTARKKAISEIQSGHAHFIVGTHALFQKDIQFSKLGLVIIDEQHRFGVQQRLALRQKGCAAHECPHQLMMTATPIPRTLAMAAYSDLDISVIDELPPGRKPVKTALISNQRRDEIIQHIEQACHSGRQAYWVCTLIEESELLQCQAAEISVALLRQQLPHLRLGLIHGRLKAIEKEQLMADFKAGHLHVLVATTVIEVGVDVPNATLMVIENAERLGLAQLHQLRGRVGRNNLDSYCILLYQSPLSQLAQTRLKVLKDHQSGFDIAQKDLELRGPGDVLGTRQAGLMAFKIADILRDKALLPDVQIASQQILQKFPQQIAPLIDRWIGKNEQYFDV